MIDFTKLWDKRYLFGPNPFDLTRSDHAFFYLAAACLALAVSARFLVWRAPQGSPKKILLSRLFHLFLTTGALLALWYGARLERIPWIYTHFTALLVLVIALVWLAFIARYFFRQYRPAMSSWQDEQQKNKYLKK